MNASILIIDDEVSFTWLLKLNLEDAGDFETALAGYETAAANWADYGHRPEEALALYGAGRCLAELGRLAEAADRLAEAKNILVGLGAEPTIAEIDALGDQAAAL